MARSDAQKRARAKYEKEKVKQVMVRFYPSENDILEFLESQFWSSGILTGNQTRKGERNATQLQGAHPV